MSFARSLAKQAWQLVQAGSPEEQAQALEGLEVAAELAPDDVEVIAAFGLALARGQQGGRALFALKGVLARPMSSALELELNCVVAELALELQRYQEARAAIERCLALDPNAQSGAGVRARALLKKAEKQLKLSTANK